MKNTTLITGLDIGSSKVTAVAAEVDRGMGFRVCAQVSFPSRGVSRGALTDLNESADSVSKTMAKLKEKIGARPGNIYVNMNGETLSAERSKGMIPLSMRGREVTRGDIDRCINVASTIQLPFDRDVIHKIVHSFSIDDQPSIKNPLGLYASRLACEMYVITANVNQIQNIHKCVNDAGYDVKGLVFTGIADGMGILTEAEKEEGAIILDVGSSLTVASMFYGGVLNDMAVIPIGMQDFRNDLKDDPEFNGLINKVSLIAEKFEKKIAKKVFIILTGGIAFSDVAIEILEAKLSASIKVGIARDVKGDISSIDSMRLTTAIGLVRYGEDVYRKKILHHKNLVQNISTKLVDIFNNYF
ncbi:MAG: cell division protein FtsA [Candidatus Omnitrophota bacterium]|jgi:cell division ATPase FtsA